MSQETYQDFEKTLQTIVPFERQMLLAEVYHYAWYNAEAYKELVEFAAKWADIMGKPILNPKIEINESKNTGIETPTI